MQSASGLSQPYLYVLCTLKFMLQAQAGDYISKVADMAVVRVSQLLLDNNSTLRDLDKPLEGTQLILCDPDPTSVSTGPSNKPTAAAAAASSATPGGSSTVTAGAAAGPLLPQQGAAAAALGPATAAVGMLPAGGAAVGKVGLEPAGTVAAPATVFPEKASAAEEVQGESWFARLCCCMLSLASNSPCGCKCSLCRKSGAVQQQLWVCVVELAGDMPGHGADLTQQPNLLNTLLTCCCCLVAL